MPRSNRPRRRARGEPSPEPVIDRDRALYGTGRLEQHPDGEWLVRPVSVAAAGKAYLCPGCRQQIPPRVAHLVAWPAEEPIGAFGGVEDRRHWHRACWTARHRRR
ncbi:MAG: hypothetical protein IPG94_15275 [Kineosporiaceae bacterium]|nr:hypothetical protein [Kineosporiaceae bacterium]